MFNRILAPLDGSDASERMAGWVAGIAKALNAEAALLAVVKAEDIYTPEARPHHADTPRSMEAGAGPYDQPRPGNVGSGTWPPGQRAGGGRPPLGSRSTGLGYIGPPLGEGEAARDVPPGAGAQVLDRVCEEARAYLKREAQRFEGNGVKTSVHVALGDPAEMIMRTAGEVEADLIAMATQRESAIARGILGSTTDRVLHMSELPMLVAHPKGVDSQRSANGAPGTIIVPLDGSALSERALPYALEMAKAAGARLLILRTVRLPYYGVAGPGLDYYPHEYGFSEQREQATAYLEPFVEQARGAGLTAEASATFGNAASRIIEAAEQESGSMIVMSTHGASGFRRWLLGSVTDKVVRSSGRPVLVLPPPAGTEEAAEE